jgi:hypothetical protein
LEENNHDKINYQVKYYKGLGTSTTQDAKYDFSNLPKHIKNFTSLIDKEKLIPALEEAELVLEAFLENTI